MAQTATNVSASKPRIGGAVHVAPAGTAVPTDATTALAEIFKSLGYISDDGMKNNNTPNTEDVQAWGGDTVLTLYSSKADTFVFKLIESVNVDVLKTVYGDDNVTGTLESGIEIKANNNELPDKVYVVDTIMRNGVLKRIVIPCGSVTSIAEIEYSDSAALGYEVTISAKADASGNTHYEYLHAAVANNG